jgi:hypothetical protein
MTASPIYLFRDGLVNAGTDVSPANPLPIVLVSPGSAAGMPQPPFLARRALVSNGVDVDASNPLPVYLAGAGGAGLTYDVAFWAGGTAVANEGLGRYAVPRALTVPAACVGSVAIAGTAPTNTAALRLTKNGAVIATISFAPGATTGTFSGSAATALVPGDALTLIAPATADSTLADVSVTISLER